MKRGETRIDDKVSESRNGAEKERIFLTDDFIFQLKWSVAFICYTETKVAERPGVANN